MQLQTETPEFSLREAAESLILPALEVLNQILNNEKASPSVRLRAALTVFKITAKPAPDRKSDREKDENVHNSAQTTVPSPIRLAPQPARNTTCPCGSGRKFKRCCAQLVETALSPKPEMLPETAQAA